MDLFKNIFKSKPKEDKSASRPQVPDANEEHSINPRQSQSINFDFSNDETGRQLKAQWNEMIAVKRGMTSIQSLEKQIILLESISSLILKNLARRNGNVVVEGHPNEFVLGMFRLYMECVEEPIARASVVKPNEASESDDGELHSVESLQEERSFQVLVVLNLVTHYPHNGYILSCDPTFCECVCKVAARYSACLNSFVESGVAEWNAISVHGLSHVVGGLTLFAQIVGRCCPQYFQSTFALPLDLGDARPVPENPWSLSFLRSLDCSWVPEHVFQCDSAELPPSSGRNAGLVNFGVLRAILALCGGLENAIRVYLRMADVVNNGFDLSSSIFVTTLSEAFCSQCESLFACLRLKCNNINPKDLAVIASTHQQLFTSFTSSQEAALLLAGKKVLATHPIGGLVARRGQLLLDLSMKLTDSGFWRNESYSGVSVTDVADMIRWQNEFCSSVELPNLRPCLSYQLIISSESADGTKTTIDLAKNLCISCEYTQEFRLSKCSVDFWPWRGQKLSAELGAYAEDIAIEDGEDVMQEMKIDDFLGRRYRMCCVNVNGFGARSVSDEVLIASRQMVMQSTGCYIANARAVDALLTSALMSPRITGDYLQSRLSMICRCSELYLEKQQTTDGNFTIPTCPDFQLHVVAAVHKMLQQWPKEMIHACRGCNLYSLLFGPNYFGGGDFEFGQIYAENIFSEDRIKRSSKVAMKVWTLRPDSDDLDSTWKGMCTFAWASLKDAILDLMCDIVQFSYSQGLGTASREIMLVSTLLKRPSHPNTSNLAATYQVTRWLRHIVHPEFKSIDRFEKCKLGKQLVIDIMAVVSFHLEIIGLAKAQSANINMIARQNTKMIWPARSCVVDFLLCLSTVEFFPHNLDWITLFLEPKSSVADVGGNETSEVSDLTSSRLRLKTLESLLLDPRCRAASMRIISRLISVYAVEMTMANDASHATATNLPNSGADQPNLKLYTFDVVGRIMSVVSYTIAQPSSVDSYNCALLCLRTLTWMLRAKKFLLLRQSIQYIFRNSDCMNTTLQAIIGILKPNEIKKSVIESADRWLLGSIVKQALALLTCIMASNDANKSHFSKLVMFNSLGAKSSVSINQLAPVDIGESSPSTKKKKQPAVSFEHFVMLLLETEGCISLEVVIVLFDMMLEAPCIRNRAVLSDPSLLSQGMFVNDDDRPKIRNSGVIIMIVSLISACTAPIQRFILLTFCNLVRGRASLANLTICSQSKPNLLDLALDLFPFVPPSNLQALVQLVQCLGRHSISVAQLKHVFRIIQGDGNNTPVYNHRVLEALQGMISNDNAPFHTFVFEGDESGLRLPPIFQWPTRSGFSFCVWFQVESPKASVMDRLDADCGDDENMNAVLNYEPYLLSIRSSSNGSSANSAGVEISLRMIAPGLFKPTVRIYSAAEVCIIEADSNVRESEWHFIAVSISGSSDWTNWTGLRSNAGAFVIVDSSCKKQGLSFPFTIQEPVFMPMIGSTPASAVTKELAKSQTSFRGQMGAIYMFSDAIPAAKLMSIQELGPSYQYNFEAFTVDYKDTFLPSKITSAALQQSSNALSVLDGTLTSSIMLSYNPAVWGNELVVDNTPSKNGIRWNVGNFASYVAEQGIIFDDRGYYKMNARARKGTYHTKSQDIRMALDSLGGIKTVFPLFSQFDKMSQMPPDEDTDPTDHTPKSISFWLFSLLSTLVQDAATRRRDVKSLGVLCYLIESVSPAHLTLEVLKIMRVIYENLAWNSPAQDNFMETILTNFKLWKNTTAAVQRELLKWLYNQLKESYARVKDYLTVQKIVDTMLFYYDSTGFVQSADIVDLSSVATVEGAGGVPSPLKQQTSLSSAELTEIRGDFLNIMGLLFSKTSTFSKEDVSVLMHYVTCTKNVQCQLEALQLLLRMLLNPSVSGKVLTRLGNSNSFTLLIPSTKSPSAAVRLYSAIVICKCFVLCSNAVAQQTSAANESVPVGIVDDMWMQQDDMNSSFVSDIRTTMRPTSHSAYSTNSDQTGPLMDYQQTAFEDLGVPPGTLMSFITLIEENLFTAMKNHSSNACLETQIIAVLFQLTMFGVGGNYDEIIAAVHYLDPSSTFLSVPALRYNNAAECDVSCSFKVKDDAPVLQLQLSTDVSICIPMIFVPLMNFIREDCVNSDLRCNVLVNLRASLSLTDNNCETILHLPFWQNCVLELLASENGKYLALQRAEKENQDGTKDTNSISRLMIKTNATCDVCLRMLCELQVAAIRIGKPLGMPIIRRKHENVAPVDIIDTLKRIGKGERNLGVEVLRETMSYLKIIGGLVSSLNVQEIGFMLIVQTLAALKREQEMLDQKRETAKDAYIEKLFNINVWLAVSIVLDFITYPLKKLVPQDDNAVPLISERSECTEPISQLSPFGSTTHQSVFANAHNVFVSGKSRARTLSSNGVSTTVNSVALEDKMIRMKSTVYSSYSVPSIGPDGSNFSDTIMEEYSLSIENCLQLINLMMELFSKFMSTGGMLAEDRRFLLAATSNIGVYTGSKLMSKIVDTVDNIITVPRNPSDSKIIPKNSTIGNLKKTPLMNATGGVSWVMIRVISSLLCKRGFISTNNPNWCMSPLTLVSKLEQWMASCESHDVDFTYFEFFNVCARLIEALRDPNLTTSNPCVRALVELAVRLVIKYRNSFYEIMDGLTDDSMTSSTSTRTVSTSSTHFLPGGIVSRLMSSFPSNSTIQGDEDSVALRPNNLYDTSNSSFVTDGATPSSTPYKSIRSTVNFGTAVQSEIVMSEAMAVFDTNSETANLAFPDLLLKIINIAINNVPGFDGSSNILRWDNWERIYEVIARQARSMEEESLHAKIDDRGLHQHISDIYNEFESSRINFCALVQNWATLSEQLVSRVDTQQQLHQSDKLRSDELARRRLVSRWNAIVSELANERGPWGLSSRNEVFWMMDARENSKRQRPRLRRNPHGSHHFIASRRRTGKKISNGNNSSSEDASIVTDSPRLNQPSVQEIWKDLLKYKRSNSSSTLDAGENNNLPKGGGEDSDNEEDDASNFSDARTISTWDNESTVLFSANVDVITISSNSTGGRSSGVLEMTRSKLTFTKSSENEPVDPSNHEFSWVSQSIPNTSWQTVEIQLLFQRMYLVQFTAIEIIFTNRLSVFFNLFSEATAKKLYRCIQRIKPPFLQVLGHRNPEKAVKSVLHGSTATQASSALILTNAWVQRQISNFDYLMSLNTIAGRTFNDLGQYPIFPWIIADYVSPQLDLTRPETFRDFRYSVGAQTEAQRQHCIQRYRDAKEMYDSNPATEFPPFHHGTHYSCMGFVFWYLVRLEPFTSLHVWLQDGKFDHPDRLFASVPDAWQGTMTNHNDVKELIPEFFYLPEFLENVNGLDLGVAQSGVPVGDVKLPPWASNSLEFIRLNREALESEYVSENLHHWIDLIFGYKQRPPMFKGHEDAVEACNVFFHLTYAEAVDLEALKSKDMELYERTIRQIDNYGQTPSRLFDRPHPQRKALSKVKVIWPIASVIFGIDTVAPDAEMPELPKKIMCFNEEKISNFPILFICEIRPLKKLVTVDAARMIGYHQFITRQPDVVPPYTFKADSAALKVSAGQQSQDNWFFSSKVQREFFVGVPFSSLELTTSKQRLLFTAQTQGVSLIGKDENKTTMIKREAERTRGRSMSEMGHSTYNLHHGSQSSRSLMKSRDDMRRNNNLVPRSQPSSSSRNVGSGTSPGNQPPQSPMPSPRDQSVSSANSGGSAVVASMTTTQQDLTQRPNAKKGKADNHLYDNLSPHLFALLPDTKLLFSCGHWDNSFKVTQVDNGRLIQSVIAHSDVVTCLALASDFNQHWLVTGSRDCTVMVWEIYPDRAHPVAVPGVVLYGHDDTVTCIAVCAELDIVMSGSDDGTVTLYSLREGTYIRSIVLENNTPEKSSPLLTSRIHSTSFAGELPPAGAGAGAGTGTGTGAALLCGVPLLSTKVEVHMVCISRENYLIVYASDSHRYLLFCYTVNGRFVERIELPERLTCMILSEDSRVLLTGGERCLVVMRWVHNLQLANDGPRANQEAVLDGKEGEQGPFGSPIRSLYLTGKERHLIVGLESGDIRILAQDSEYLRKRLVSNLEDIGLITSSSMQLDG